MGMRCDECASLLGAIFGHSVTVKFFLCLNHRVKMHIIPKNKERYSGVLFMPENYYLNFLQIYFAKFAEIICLLIIMLHNE